LPVGTEERQETRRCGEPESQRRFYSIASLVEVYSVTARPACSVASENIQVLLCSKDKPLITFQKGANIISLWKSHDVEEKYEKGKSC
jgi:hypothetical protein